MLNQSAIGKLKSICGEKNVITSKIGMYAYGYDGTLLWGVPEGIVMPESTKQVVDVVNFCREQGITLVPRGAGTNESGGSVPVDGCIVINFSRMKKVLEIDLENYVAIVEPGVVNWDIQEILAKYGYYYPPDPASWKASTLGGNLGECSGGPKCFKYGVTRDFIYGLEVVLPSGKVIWVGGKDFSSEPMYDLTRIFVGSEGTIGFITKIAIRIQPNPAAKKTMLAIYETPEDCSQGVADIVAAGIIPTTLEMMDNLIINTTEDFVHSGNPRDAGALIIIEVDGYPGDLDEQVALIGEIVKKAKARDFKVAQTAEEVDKIWLARRVAFGSVARVKANYGVNDITVPRSNFPQAIAGIEKVKKDYGVTIGTCAHAGDGNLHPLVLFDQRNQEEVELVHKAEKALCKLAIDLKGTVSGEHGIGLVKKPLLFQEFSPQTMDVFKKIKRAFDPQNHFNPTKLIDL
jgi:glycolate oxidase